MNDKLVKRKNLQVGSDDERTEIIMKHSIKLCYLNKIIMFHIKHLVFFPQPLLAVGLCSNWTKCHLHTIFKTLSYTWASHWSIYARFSAIFSIPKFYKETQNQTLYTQMPATLILQSSQNFCIYGKNMIL